MSIVHCNMIHKQEGDTKLSFHIDDKSNVKYVIKLEWLSRQYEIIAEVATSIWKPDVYMSPLRKV